MSEPNIILEEANPYGTRIAVVENDGRSVYLYLSPPEDLPGDVHAVWLRNLVPAPDDTDREAMQAGRAPLLRRAACRHPEGGEAPPVKELDLVWFSEGTGVALYVNGELDALIPPWAGLDGFQGYAREAKAADAGTVPLPDRADNAALFERVEENLRFWTERSAKNHWPQFRDRLLGAYENIYGPHKNYYVLQDRAYPPLAVAEFEVEDGLLYATVGMSNQNMPGVEKRKVRDPYSAVRTEILSYTAERREWLPGLLGRMAILPWLTGDFMAHGHTYESGLEQADADFVLTNEFQRLGLRAPDAMVLDELYTVNWLLAIPIPQEFLMVAKMKGAQHVLDKLYD